MTKVKFKTNGVKQNFQEHRSESDFVDNPVKGKNDKKVDEHPVTGLAVYEERPDQHELLESIESGEFTPRKMTDLPVVGDPPENARGETGIWSWNEDDQECIVGQDNLKVVSYERANEIYE